MVQQRRFPDKAKRSLERRRDDEDGGYWATMGLFWFWGVAAILMLRAAILSYYR